ncbi:MAG: ATP-dependent DNA helicase, partial [Planctomycetota bacterium]
MPLAAEECLAPGACVARALEGFRDRPQQRRMAEVVEEAVAGRRHLVVEAGTGVGKSFAYLVPVMLHLARGGGPVAVATRTIALQEQLVRRDIPLLLDALGLQLDVALAKGRGNYVCRRRLELAHTEGGSLFGSPDERRQLERIVEWARRSEDGSLADLPLRPAASVWETVRAERGNCLHQRCRFYRPCAYQRSRRRMYRADLVVANHALILADLALREAGARYLPDYEVLVLDEAHALEDGAADHFGFSMGPLGLARQLARLHGTHKQAGLLGRVGDPPRLHERVEAVAAAARLLFDGVARRRGDRPELRLRRPGQFENPLSSPLRDLLGSMHDLHPQISDPEVALEWKARTDRLEEHLSTVELVHGLLDPELVYWIEAAGRGRRSVLRAAPVEVAPVLRRALFRRVPSVILTSATLRVGGSFDHFESRVGLDEPAELGLGSPFDFRRQCRLLLHPPHPHPPHPPHDPAGAERGPRG